MKLGYVALKLRLANTSFENRIGGSAALGLALESTLSQEMIFVIPLTEAASANDQDNSVNQVIAETFGLVVALKMDADLSDKTGIKAFDRLHDIRQELFSALLGWQIPGTERLCSYRGGRLLEFNPAWLWYQFEFDTATRLGANDMALPDETGVGWLDKIYAQYVLGAWDDSSAAAREAIKGAPPWLTINETAVDGLRLVDMAQMIQKEED